MSQNDFKLIRKRDRSHSSAKPYSRPCQQQKSIINKITDRIVPNWMRSLWSSSDGNDDNDNLNTTSVDAHVENRFAPDSKQIDANASFSTRGVTSSSSVSSYETRWTTSNATTASSPLLMPSTSASYRQQKVPREQQKQTVGDDEASSSTDATASTTSGCSSLVPSHQENNLYLGFDFNKIRKEMSLNKTRDMSTSTDTQFTSNQFLGKEKTPRSREFSVSTFMTSSTIIPPHRKSPFYEGNTMFGGRYASRAARMASNPYKVATSNPLVPVVKIRPILTNRSESSDHLSAGSKYYFDKMEKESTPIQDARRIPFYENRFNATRQLISQSSGQYKRRRFGPPTTSSPIPGNAIIDTKNKPIKFDFNTDKTESNLPTIREESDRNLQQNAKSVSEEVDNKSTPQYYATSGGGGKMRSSLLKKTHKEKDDMKNDTFIQPPVPHVALVFPSEKPLPTFNLSSSSIKDEKKASAIESNDKKKMPTTTIKVAESDDEIHFSQPILKGVINRKNIQKSTISSPISFSTPKLPQQEDASKNEEKPVDEKSRKTNNVSPSLKSNVIKESVPKDVPTKLLEGSSVTKPLDKMKEAPKEEVKTPVKPLSSWGEEFKAKQSSGSWNCPTCMVNNSSDKLKCPCCETLKPAATQASTTSTSTTSTVDAPKSLWGNTFKPANSWECPACMINNTNDKLKCAACETPKPGATTVSMVKTPTREGKDEWMCDICHTKNTSPGPKCISCKSLRLLENKSLIKQTDGYKFGDFTKNDFKFGFGFTSNATITNAATIANATITNALPQNVVKDNDVSKKEENASLFKFGMPAVSNNGNTPITDFVNKTTSTTTFPSDTPLIFSTGESVASKTENLAKETKITPSLFPPPKAADVSVPKISFNFGLPSTTTVTSSMSSTTASTTTQSISFNLEKNVSPVKTFSFSSTPVTTTSTSSAFSPLPSTVSNALNASSSLPSTLSLAQSEPPKNIFASVTKPFSFSSTPSTQATEAKSIEAPTISKESSQNLFVFGKNTTNSNQSGNTFATSSSTTTGFSFPIASSSSSSIFAPKQEAPKNTTSGLFGSVAPKTAPNFQFGATPQSETSVSGTSFTNSFNSNNAPAAASSFTAGFGSTSKPFLSWNQNSVQFGSSNVPPSNNTISSPFTFGAQNQPANQPNTQQNIFGNVPNPLQQNFPVFSQTQATNGGFNFSREVHDQPQHHVQQQQPQQPLASVQPLTFSQQPMFNFSGGAPSSSGGANQVFQFSAEQNPNALNSNPIGRNYKKAKRRLGPN